MRIIIYEYTNLGQNGPLVLEKNGQHAVEKWRAATSEAGNAIGMPIYLMYVLKKL